MFLKSTSGSFRNIEKKFSEGKKSVKKCGETKFDTSRKSSVTDVPEYK